MKETDIIKRIKKNGTREKEVLQALQKKNGSAWEEDEVAYMEGRIYIPNNKDIKGEILRENHDPVDVGHPGQHRMQELIKRTYWWPELKEDVKKYVQGYIKCQQNKMQHQKKAGELHLVEIPEGPWQDISIDMIGPLPRSNEMDAILVIVDRFIKMIRLKVTTTSLSSEGVAKIKYGRYMEYPRRSLATAVHNLHQSSWKTLQEYWEPRGNCLQHITLRLMDRQKESTKK